MARDKQHATTALVFTGGDRYLPGVPARDLDEADLARLAYVRAVAAARAAAEPDPDPGAGDASAIRAELLGSGYYVEA